MNEAEKSNERQAAYSTILDAIRRMTPHRTVGNITKLINEIANKDDAWKSLPHAEATAIANGPAGDPAHRNCTPEKCFAGGDCPVK